MRQLLLSTLLLASLAPQIHADDTSKNAKIEELFRITHADQLVQQMMDQIRPMISQQMKSMNLPADSGPAVEEMIGRMMPLLSERLKWETLKPRYTKIYAESLSEQELDAFIEFYKSPSGQSVMKKLPIIMQKSMAVVQPLIADVIPEFAKIAEDVAKKYKK